MPDENALADRGLKDAKILFAECHHGTRHRYLAGCKCFYCRRANSDYERQRERARNNGDWNGIVDSERARKHIVMLSRAGVGRRTLSEQSGVGKTIIMEIKNGKKKRIRARTERKILAVLDIHQRGSTLVDALDTWAKINELIAEGFTLARIALELGYRTPKLQFDKKLVAAKTAKKVRALHRHYMFGN